MPYREVEKRQEDDTAIPSRAFACIRRDVVDQFLDLAAVDVDEAFFSNCRAEVLVELCSLQVDGAGSFGSFRVGFVFPDRRIGKVTLANLLNGLEL